MSALEELPTELLECRDLRHAWEGQTNFVVDGREITRIVQCMRCKTKRQEYYKLTRGDSLAKLGRPRYRYLEGYALPVGEGGFESVKSEVFRRFRAEQ